MAELEEDLFAVSALAQQIWEKMAKRQVPSGALFLSVSLQDRIS